jgi:hypothetical protein
VRFKQRCAEWLTGDFVGPVGAVVEASKCGVNTGKLGFNCVEVKA